MKSYLHKYSIDFNKTFAAIIKLIAFKVLLAIITFYNLDIDKINIKIVFLYSLIN